MRKSAFRKISEWGISVSDVEEIRPVHLFQVFPSTFLNHLCVCVCMYSNKQTGQYSLPTPHWLVVMVFDLRMQIR